MARAKDPRRKPKRRAPRRTEAPPPVAIAIDEPIAADAAAPSEVKQTFLKVERGCIEIWRVTALSGDVVSIEPLGMFASSFAADAALAELQKKAKS